jgi:hypothetical protein
LGNTLVYVQDDESRLFYKVVAPHPCSATLSCPDGLTCGADLLCR